MKKVFIMIGIICIFVDLNAAYKNIKSENIFKEMKKDENITSKLYETACKEGSAISCYELGFIYNAGKGVNKDYEKARQFYTVSCNAGFARACTRLGLLYGKGHGVKVDMKKAIMLFKKGCEGGHFDGCTVYNTFK